MPLVYIVGYYDNLEDALNKLKEYIPNYIEGLNNTVTGNHIKGWINKNDFGDMPHAVVASHPHSAINLFE